MPDYPGDKLDVKLIVEECDNETVVAAQVAAAHGEFEVVVVPRGQPQTKPRACNYALSFARLALLALAQPAYDSAHAFQAAFVSFAAYAVTASAEAFVHRQDPRRIMALGGSLAGAQLASPIWGTITMLVLPLAIRRSLPTADAARLAGLYLSLLFIPVLMTFTLMVMSAGGWIAFPSWQPLRSFSSIHWIDALAILLTALPLALTWKRQFAATQRIPIAVCTLIILTGTASWLLGTAISDIALRCGAAIGVVTLWVVSRWPSSPERRWRSALAVAASPAVCWLLALTMGALHA